MENIALIGIDLGKNSFHIHCQDHRGKAVYRKKFTRPKLIEFLATCPATTIAMEACGGSHFMARKLEELGHFPKLISPQFVRPFVKSNKNDFVDAEAICEAASRPSMRFVQPRTESQQAMRALHRVRESLVQDKVKTTNQMHAFLLEFGISVPRGAAVISRLSTLLEDSSLPLYLSQLLLKLQQHYHYLVEQIKDLESQLKRKLDGTVAKLAMRQPFVLFKGLTFQKLCLPGAFRPGDHHNKMLRPGLCVVHASPQYL
ncbi:transposase [Enterobacter sp. MGH 14]|nr:transposase [Enterobacter sp. MGH 14]OUF18928.1 transposase [Enterobacter hormaechei]